MPLVKEDYEAIGQYVRQHLGDWLSDQSLARPLMSMRSNSANVWFRVEEAEDSAGVDEAGL